MRESRQSVAFSLLGFDADGKAQAGMGLDPGDWDGDGRFDLAVSNFAYEPNNIFHNLGNSLFEEISRTTKRQLPVTA